jgi:predicted ATPase/class 3 adenylate cyclase
VAGEVALEQSGGVPAALTGNTAKTRLATVPDRPTRRVSQSLEGTRLPRRPGRPPEYGALGGAVSHDPLVRADLPSGTVTFLFTDIEGSTGLLDELGPDAYARAVADHRRIVREACTSFGGSEVDTQGDAFFLAFAQAPSALETAAVITERLGEGPIRVRIGLHTGTPLVTAEGYAGADVHRAARIAAAGHGGQVLVSHSTATLVDTPLRDLGEHRFKDLGAAERVFQLGEAEFPPLQSLHRSNLPMPATPFLGREAELAVVSTMLEEAGVRLVSLVGPGGTGKTRLALQAAAEASDSYPDGVFWAPLAPLRDPALVLPTVAAALSVGEGKDGSAVDDLARGLAGRRLLVFIDNVEHLLPNAADSVNAFLAGCPTVTVVVTSRERLQTPGERAYAVPPMSESDGEALFRSRAADAGVELRPSTELRTLCEHLDNLPLALELAAARTVVFSPAQLLDRLSQRLDLLRAGRGVDARQETLRSTIAWSHDLLDRGEQALFRRMSVFAGSCSFESAEQVVGADPDLLQSLLDKSLLRRRDGKVGRRFWMLETIREFAAEQLEAAGETDDVQRRHLEHYAALAEACFDDTLLGHDDLDRLEEERENVRVAVDLALEIEPELALELGRRVMPSWTRRGEFREGRERLAAALSRAPHAPGLARAWALRAAASLASQQSDLAVADSLGYEALALFRELGDQRGVGWTLNVLGWNAMARGDYGEARRLYEEAAEAHSDPGDEQLQRRALMSLANVESVDGDYARAVSLLRDVVASTRREGSTLELALALGNLGTAEDQAGETEQARRSLEETIALHRQDARKPGLAVALCNLGYLLRATDPVDALAHFSESLTLSREIEEPRTIAYCLEGGAGIIAARGNPTDATTLLAAASTIRALTGAVASPVRRAKADTLEAQCREALSPEVFARAWEEGASLDAMAAADWALRFWEETE